MYYLTFYIFLVLYAFMSVHIALGQLILSGSACSGLGITTPVKNNTNVIFSNPALLASAKSTSMTFSLENHYSFPGLYQMRGGLLLKLPAGKASSGLFRIGDRHFSYHEFSLGYANTMGLVSLGLRTKIIQWHIDPLTTIHKLGIDFGGVATLSPSWFFGAYIINLNYPLISKNDHERVPMTMLTGIAYVPSDKVYLQTEIIKSIDHPPVLNIGLQYMAIENMGLRTNLSTNPLKSRFGILFTANNLSLEYSSTLQYPLGQSHLWSITYKL